MKKLREGELLEILRIQLIGCQIEGRDPCQGCEKKKHCYLPQAHQQIREIIVQHFEEDTLPGKLKSFMAEKGLIIKDVSDITEKDPKTIWQFLHQKVKANGRTTYSIRKLLGEDVKK